MKLFWNNNLTFAGNNMRSAWKEWVNQCHCHDSNSVAFVKYKNTKRCFLCSLRKAFDEYESLTERKLEKKIDIYIKSMHATFLTDERRIFINDLINELESSKEGAIVFMILIQSFRFMQTILLLLLKTAFLHNIWWQYVRTIVTCGVSRFHQQKANYYNLVNENILLKHIYIKNQSTRVTSARHVGIQLDASVKQWTAL